MRLRIFQKPTRDSGPPRTLTNSARARSPLEQRAPPLALIRRDPRARLLADRNEPLLVAFADARQVVLGQMQVRRPHRDQLGHAHARSHTAARSSRDPVVRSPSRHPAAAISRSTSSSDRNLGSAGHARGGWRSSAGLRFEATVEHEKSVKAADGRDACAPPIAATVRSPSAAGRMPRAPAGPGAQAAFSAGREFREAARSRA